MKAWLIIVCWLVTQIVVLDMNDRGLIHWSWIWAWSIIWLPVAAAALFFAAIWLFCEIIDRNVDAGNPWICD